MNKGTILLFHMNIFKTAPLVSLCEEMNLSCRVCTAQEEQIPLRKLLKRPAASLAEGLPGTAKGKASLSEEMLIMCGLEEEMMDRFLAALRSRQLGVSLKAVLTPVNSSWSAMRLGEELKRERAAFARTPES